MSVSLRTVFLSREEEFAADAQLETQATSIMFRASPFADDIEKAILALEAVSIRDYPQNALALTSVYISYSRPHISVELSSVRESLVLHVVYSCLQHVGRYVMRIQKLSRNNLCQEDILRSLLLHYQF